MKNTIPALALLLALLPAAASGGRAAEMWGEEDRTIINPVMGSLIEERRRSDSDIYYTVPADFNTGFAFEYVEPLPEYREWPAGGGGSRGGGGGYSRPATASNFNFSPASNINFSPSLSVGRISLPRKVILFRRSGPATVVTRTVIVQRPPPRHHHPGSRRPGPPPGPRRHGR